MPEHRPPSFLAVIPAEASQRRAELPESVAILAKNAPRPSSQFRTAGAKTEIFSMNNKVCISSAPLFSVKEEYIPRKDQDD